MILDLRRFRFRAESTGTGHGLSVSESDIAQGPFLWTRGIAARETLRYLDKHGIDAEPLLSRAELSRAGLTEDPAGISVVSQLRFLELAASETNDPLLGLHVAAELDMRDIGILFYLVAASATVAEALNILSGMAQQPTKKSASRSPDMTIGQS